MNEVELLEYLDKKLINDNDERAEEIKKFLGFLYENAEEGDVFEVRALSYNKKTLHEIVFCDNTELAAPIILDFEKQLGAALKGVYVTVNVSNREKTQGKETIKDEDVTKILNFIIDIDVHDRVLSAQERAVLESAIIQTVNEIFGGKKTIVAFSGFGFHVFVKLKPIELVDDEVKVAYRSVASKLAQQFVIKLREKLPDSLKKFVEKPDLSVYNPSRIMRVAWTLNRRYINDTAYVALDKIVFEGDGDYLDLSSEIQAEIKKLLNADEQILINGRGDLTSEEIDKIAEIVAPLWTKGRRHFLALGVSAFLYWRGVSYESARAVIEKIVQKTGDEEKEDRIRALDDTYKASVLKAYRTHFRTALESEEKVNEFIFKLNNVLKSYYERVSEGKIKETDEEAITGAAAVLRGDFDLLTFMLEHTVEALKEIDEKSGVITYKLTFFDSETNKNAIIVFKDAAKDFYKVFETINNRFFENFAHFIVSKSEINLLDKATRSEFRAMVTQIMQKYVAFIVKNSRTIIKEEYEEVKNEFLETLEFMRSPIIKIPSRSFIQNETFGELLKKYKLVYIEDEEKIALHKSFFDHFKDPTSIARNLAKLFYRLRIIDNESFRHVRRQFRVDDRREAYYELNAQKFFKFLDEENADYDIVEYDPSSEFEPQEVIE